MAEQPRQEGALLRFQAMPWVASGRALLASMVVLLVCDVIGGFIGVATGAETWGGAWGFDTESTVPLPVGAVQLVLAWLAARNVRPPVGRIAAVVLSAFCLLSVLAGLFDGDLIGTVASDGFLSWRVLWAVVVLLPVTAAVGLLAATRARQLRRRP
ncbi:hypothetical protein EKO23_17670 [Nocardioides guangzhouensis]|uniref:Uncharacterized protein n=1 Tax=Nocardioides guangzhouensis TaxID=2497878 RepID=A0A4Q4Z9Q0_9ACTN|nr:hypothetical protein [Nocardioides guangzhouensis]RYP83906.1 hypothetical protein EKO23_17670 [Nocardioides guangzhouensis]